MKTKSLRQSSASPLLVTYYTEDTPYHKMALQLLGDCNRLGLPIKLIGVPSLDSRQQNQRQKVYVLRDFMIKYDRPLLWIDADSRLWKKPVQFEDDIKNNIDFVAYYRNAGLWQGWKGGVMFFNNTPRAKSLLGWMVKIADYNPMCNDESVLKLALEQVAGLQYRPLNSNLSPQHPYFSDVKEKDTVIQIQYSGQLKIWGDDKNPKLWHPADDRTEEQKWSEVIPSLLPGNKPPQTLHQGQYKPRASPPLNDKYFYREQIITVKFAKSQISLPNYDSMVSGHGTHNYNFASFPELSFQYNYNVIEYKYYFLKSLQNVRMMPPLEAIFAPQKYDRHYYAPWRIYDGKKRLAALFLLAEQDPRWNQCEIKVRFYKHPLIAQKIRRDPNFARMKY